MPLNEDDVLSDGTEQSDNEFFKCCKSKKCANKVCVNCLSLFHERCAIKNPNLKVLENGKLICCEKPGNIVSSEVNDKLEKKTLLLEIEYLRQLLEETRDKNNILKLNNELLINRINTLEKNNKKNEDSAVNNRHINKGDALTTVKKTVTGNEETHLYHLQMEQQHKQNKFYSDITKQKSNESAKTPAVSNVNRNRNQNKQTQSAQNTTADVNNIGTGNNVADSDSSQFITYRERKSRRQSNKGKTIGTGKTSEFTGPEKKVWIYLYRINRTATEEKIKEYIKNTEGFENDNITVKEIPTAENALRRYVITAPFNKKENLYKPEFWPTGVGVKRFDFARHKEFLTNQAGDFLL